MRIPFFLFFIYLNCLITISAQDNKSIKYPLKDWSKIKNPIASEDAEPGGRINIFGSQSPKSFNYYLDTNQFTNSVFSVLFETLLSLHPITLERMPGICNQWEISEDKLTYTMTIDPNAKWSDGKPITSADVVFTYETVIKNMTGPWLVEFKKINKPEIIDEKKFKIVAKENHWKMEGIIADIIVLPKHAMEGKDFEKINFEFPVVSGPYKIKENKEDNYLELERRTDWWARYSKFNEGTYNFQFIKFKFFMEDSNGFESFKKGELDLFPVYMAKRWINEAVGEKYDKNHIVKQKVFNFHPIGFQGFAMNMRKDLFKDKKVRLAMAHLLNRERLNEELMFKQYVMTSSYFTDLYNKEIPNKNINIEFNKEKARKLFEEAGWKLNANGILEKDGKPFEFTFLTNDTTSNKFLDIYSDDLKNQGIKLNIVKKDWAAFAKDMDSYNYEMTWSAWGGGIYKDPENAWSSKEIDTPSGNNYPGFSNAEVDKLIEQQKTEFDLNKRNEICRKIDNILTEEVPYILLWNNNHSRLLYWNKFGTPTTVLDKYNDEASCIVYWWYDKDADKALEDAIKNNKALPKKKASIYFEEEFKGK